jgi:phage gpG-like protein
MAKNRGGTESLKRKIDLLNRIKTQLPNELAKESVKFFRANFGKQGFLDQSVQKWKKRKDNKKHLILVKSGALRESIEIESADWRRIRIVSDLPYSAIHNEGRKGLAWGKHPFQMPKRKFMGRSYELHKKLRFKLETAINRVMKA